MLLSDKDFSQFVRDNFVASWEQVRPVPKVSIDFGNGKKLDRTLVGNTVLYVCLPDGQVVDAFPGVYLPKDLQPALEGALAMLREAAKSNPSLEGIRQFHQQTIATAFQKEALRISTSKAFVESPLLDALGKPARRRDYTNEEAQIPNRGDEFERYARRLDDASSRPMSPGKVREWILGNTKMTPEEIAQAIVKHDSETNIRYVRPAIHLLLRQKQMVGKQPGDLRNTIFKDLLHIDIDDPYLGLSDLLLPGTPPGRDG